MAKASFQQVGQKMGNPSMHLTQLFGNVILKCSISKSIGYTQFYLVKRKIRLVLKTANNEHKSFEIRKPTPVSQEIE